MSFERMKVSGTKKKSTYVAEQILEAINKGKYKVGDKLPPETVIAEEMGISRVPVREALSALQIAGIVESVTGDGTYIRKLGKLAGIKPLALMILGEGESPFEALRARKILEIGVVSIIMDKSNPKSLPEVEKVLERMMKAVKERNLDRYFETNRDFHLALTKITENSLIERFMEYLLDIMNQPLWMEAVQKHFVDYEHVREYADRHRRIYAAICSKDGELALKEVKDHFDKTVEEVKKYL